MWALGTWGWCSANQKGTEKGLVGASVECWNFAVYLKLVEVNLLVEVNVKLCKLHPK